jgi:hypothetical protein
VDSTRTTPDRRRTSGHPRQKYPTTTAAVAAMEAAMEVAIKEAAARAATQER